MWGMWLGTLLMGCSVAALAVGGSGYYNTALDAIERDFREKLRRMRVSTRNLRRTLILWSILIGIVFVGFWLGLDAVVFGITAAALLAAGPWYLLRRMA